MLGPSAVTLIILALIQFVQKLRENRTTLRGGYETREQERNEGDRRWIAAYRTAAEAHLPWDIEVRSALIDLRHEVNHGRVERGEAPRVWEPLPQAPPLFPTLDDHEKSAH